MTVYVDVLFAVNLFLNYFLLLITAGLAKVPCKRLRVIAASVAGGIYGVVVFMSEISFFKNLIIKLSFALAVCLIAFGFKSARTFIRCTVLFLTVGFMFGGLLYGVYFLFKPNIMLINNSAVYFHISPVLLILLSALSYVAILLFTYFLKPQTVNPLSEYTVHIVYHSKSVSAVGFVDTGNSLTDIFTDTPVILCSYDTVNSLFDSTEQLVFKNYEYISNVSSLPKKIRLIPVCSVSGSTLLPSFRPDRLELETDGKKTYIERVLVAVFNPAEYATEHSVILNPELILSENRGGKANVK